jgi:hypothetical protein
MAFYQNQGAAKSLAEEDSPETCHQVACPLLVSGAESQVQRRLDHAGELQNLAATSWEWQFVMSRVGWEN